MSDTEIRPSQVVGQLLVGQTVVVIGGSSGIGLETARLARTEGADVVITGRDHARLEEAANDVGATSVAAFDATDFERLAGFFDELPAPIDHVLVTGPGPYYAPLSDFDVDAARRDLEAHLLLPIQVTRDAAAEVRVGGTLLFMGGTGGRADQRRVQPHLGAHGRRPRDGQELGARSRAGAGEHDRGRIRRHTAVGEPARRQNRRAARRAPPDAPDRAGRRTG